ncbi:MAG: DUF1223 domain-containing protein [Ferruginibacter sp.]
MKLILISLAFLAIAGFALNKTYIFSGECTKPPMAKNFMKTSSSTNPASSSAIGFAVVELFTSEGCSSCPSADALMGKLAAENKEHVYVLSYHVDYWDRLGWKDAFSKPEWSARQAAYVKNFHLESAYTPQAVVNGTTEFVGSGKLQLYNSVNKELNATEAGQLQVEAVEKNGKIKVKYEAPPLQNTSINLALVQLHSSTQVTRGENGGKRLEHTNVVQELATLNPSDKKEILFSTPANFNVTGYKIVAFIQNKKDLKITAAAEATIKTEK